MKSQWSLQSPNNQLTLEFTLTDAGTLQYHVKRQGVILLEKAAFGLISDAEDFSTRLVFVESAGRVIDEPYAIPAFKADRCRNRCNVLELTFEKNGNRFVVEGRAFDDGVAFRGILTGEGSGEIRSEDMAYRLPEDAGDVYAQKFIYAYGDYYETVPHADLFQNRYAMPLLVQSDRQIWMLLTEAEITGYYCGSNLQSSEDMPLYLKFGFSPDQIGGVQQTYPMRTPWRSMIIGTLADIVSSCLIENLNPPCALPDTSWIKPGYSAWSCLAEIESMPESEMRTHEKDYIDLAARMRWPYSTLDFLWPKLNIPELAAYAKERGVGLWLWAHRQDLTVEESVREQFSKWSKWGVVGVKIDYFDSDSQKSFRYQDTILKVAAEYGLMINFHGASKASGVQRTYPHLMTVESALGAEFQSMFSYYIPVPSSEHNCTLPFIANAVGPMDYTPGLMKAFRSFTTDMHQFALSIVFESHVQHFPDTIEMLDGHPARGLLVEMPTAWDEILLLEGFPGRYATIARRKDTRWYIGSICSKKPRVARFALDFLDDDNDYEMTVYADGYREDADPVSLPSHVKPAFTDEEKSSRLGKPAPCLHQWDCHAVRTTTRTVRRGEMIGIPLLASGGLAIVLHKR